MENLRICHKCGKDENQTDLVLCSLTRCDRAVCCDCATELEWEIEACRDHAVDVHRGIVASYRNSIRRAA